MMSDFIQSFKQNGDISFLGMRKTAMTLLPDDKVVLDKLYEGLKRGKCIPKDDLHLNMYLRSFGKMHKAKLDAAFNTMPGKEIFDREIEIYDWGCGQGTATICLLDFLKEKKANVKAINLIDPSSLAVSRAGDVIGCYGDIPVNKVTKCFDKLTENDFSISSVRKLHLFSNILDVESFDLAQFIHLFQKTFSGDNYFVCVGPYYSNDRRLDEFLAAMDPDAVFAISHKEKGEWKNDWSISIQVFFKQFRHIETVQDIRRRIERSHMHQQFFAGYILDAVAEDFKDSEFGEESEGLYRALSAFDVKSNIPLEHHLGCDSKIAVLANIVSRGLPTKAPVLLENLFSDKFHISEKPVKGAVLEYNSMHRLTALAINEALHVIDPRFNTSSYNGDMLENSFEKGFIGHCLKGTDNEYLIQILEPQRSLSTIIDIPDRCFLKDQKVDFALEIPYGDSPTDFIFSRDGQYYYSNVFKRTGGCRGDQGVVHNGCDAYRIEQPCNADFVNKWKQETSFGRYLSVLKKNFSKALTGSWNETLQIVLSPMAVARVERILLEAMMSGDLDISRKKWNIVVIERDVPCAAMAIKDLQEKYAHVCALAGSSDKLPEISLSIVSTEEFKTSPLHLGREVESKMPVSHFDMCIDISMLLRDNIEALPLNIDAQAIYLIRSSHYKKRDRTVCTAKNIQYPALVVKDATGSYKNIPEREKILTYFLQEIFRKPSFRNGQLPILSRALADRTTIGLLPTGGGKSLTYQLSCMLQPGVSIIVDPLVSLMVDQVRGLRHIRIDACDCVNSGMDGKEKSQKLNLLQNGSVMFMLLSPERFMMKNFRESLSTMYEKNHVSFSYGVIDEVHCVSEWGHDFRTSYLHLGRNMINFMHTSSGKPLSVIGLTATASFDVLADVERELTMGGNLSVDSETVVRPENDTRPELTYRIINVNSDFDSLRDPTEPYILKAGNDWDLKEIIAESKKKEIIRLLDEIPSDIALLNSGNPACKIKNFAPDKFYDKDANGKYPNAGIIFCPHAHGTFGVQDNEFGNRNGIATSLIAEKKDLKIGTFIGGDNPSGDMKAFNDDEDNLMIATKAFGMGIDKPDVRYTIHVNNPSSIEEYVQEAGRGGRDRKFAISYVLFDPTKYVQLTVDKINKIRNFLAQDNDPSWLENYKNKFVLLSDFPELCRHNNATKEQIQTMLDIMQRYDYIENVDKNIDLWFHNNSFRGLFKEKVILKEMTERILNVKPTYLLEIQRKLRKITGNNDVRLKVIKNAISIFSEEYKEMQYGYIFLDNLRSSYKYINFDFATCKYISECLIDILKAYKDHSAAALSRPLGGKDNIVEGIFSAMEKAGKDGYVYVTVSWENQVFQDPEDFEHNVRAEITAIAQANNWRDLNEYRFGKLDFNRVTDFDDLIRKIYKCSGNDDNWNKCIDDETICHKLKMAFYRKRDKDDTDKAIYRMCCVGLVEDLTIDYISQTYELKIRKRTDEEFRENMLAFFQKYYSVEQAKKRVEKINQHKGKTYLHKCLGCLTDFVYENLEKKRYRAIEDMCIACEENMTEGSNTSKDKQLKEFIHLYFNSKYARTGYTVGGQDYSLSEDTKERDDFSLVEKYIDVMTKDSSGSEVDNVKHLYGATLLCLRAHTDNAALMLFLAYCITFLGAGSNETLRANALNGYIEGFLAIYHEKGPEVWKYIDRFNDRIRPVVHDDYIKDNLVEKGKETIMLFIHGERLNAFTQKYLN